MPSYISAYDTEAVYAWWDVPTGPGYQGRISYEGERLAECIAGVRAVAQVHLERQAPASFFIVAELLQCAASEFRAILDEPLFDIQCHSFTHKDLIGLADADDQAALQHELVDSKKLIEDTFSRPVIGLTAPGGYTRGFIGQERILHVMWEAGYRYMRTVGAGPDGTMPAPLNRPFWYAREGFPGLLEMPSHAWHDNILTGQPGKVLWPPQFPWPYPAHMPEDAQGVYAAYAPGIDYVQQANLPYYLPIFHPWSVYRIDRRARQLDLLLRRAQTENLPLISCTQQYEHALAHKSQIPDASPDDL